VHLLKNIIFSINDSSESVGNTNITNVTSKGGDIVTTVDEFWHFWKCETLNPNFCAKLRNQKCLLGTSFLSAKYQYLFENIFILLPKGKIHIQIEF